MRIDVHAHYWTGDYLDLLVDLGQAAAGAVRGIGAGGGAELEARLRLMDRAGVQMQVLSACPQLPYGQDGQKTGRAARFVNDQYAGLVQRRPDRFRAFAALPMPHLEESLGEMGRALDDLRMAGIAMNTTVLGHALVDPEYEPVFAELNSRSAVLYLHPAGNSACSPLIGNYHLTWMAGAPVEDTISIMHLIMHGIPARYPSDDPASYRFVAGGLGPAFHPGALSHMLAPLLSLLGVHFHDGPLDRRSQRARGCGLSGPGLVGGDLAGLGDQRGQLIATVRSEE